MFYNRLVSKSDEELMTFIQQGHERAFSVLYERYAPQLVRYFFRMLWKDEPKAHDFLHDLFLKIIERPEYYDSSRKFSTWLYSVAHNMCKNEYRKQRYRNAVALEPEQHAVEPSVHAEIDEKNFSVLLETALQSWSEDDRTLFVLKHEMEMTYAEIGAVLGCPEGTARSRWFYLRKNLAARLHEYHTIIK